MTGLVVKACGNSENQSNDIRQAAMKLLVRREQSRQELRAKLARKFPDTESLVEQEMEKLSEEGLQSDLRYSEMVVRSGINKYLGPLRIVAELRNKGVDESTISAAISEEEVDWSGLIVALDRKKYGAVPLPIESKELAKRIRFFRGKGYQSEHIDLVVREKAFSGP